MNLDILSQLNWLAILVAALAYFILGALWYSKLLFAGYWTRSHNINMSDPDLRKGAGAIMFLSLLCMIVACIGLEVLRINFGITDISYGIKLGIGTGVCFSMMGVVITFLYLKKPFGILVVDGLYHVAGQALAGAILAYWPV